MMRISRMLAVAVVLLLVAATPALARGPGDEVPIKGTVTGVHWIDEEAPGCSGEPLWRFSSSGSGKLSHLGRIDYFLTQCSYFDPEQGFVFRSGTITFTAPNGDTLVVAQMGSAGIIPSDVPGEFAGFTVQGTWQAAGGTGRFMSATGSGAMSGIGDIPGGGTVFDLPDGAAVFDFVGDIAYDASDRAN